MGDSDEPPLSRSATSRTSALRFGPSKDKRTNPGSHAAATSDSTLAEKQSSRAPDELHHGSPAPATPSDGEAAATVEKAPMPTRMKNGIVRFWSHTKAALLYSWVNVLLLFVPIGIAVHAAGLSPVIVFSMNAIAIIPLAGLLAHATEAVAARLGDTLGALLNVSFGNAVELILFIILLAGNQIEVVQAALLGSILANLLLILGMAFLLGGLRYQEQVILFPCSPARAVVNGTRSTTAPSRR